MEQHFKSFLGDPGLVDNHRATILLENQRAGLDVLVVGLRPKDSGPLVNPNAPREVQLESLLSPRSQTLGEPEG